MNIFGRPNNLTKKFVSERKNLTNEFLAMDCSEKFQNNTKIEVFPKPVELSAQTHFFSLFLCQMVEPSFPKKKFLKLLSTPITSNPLLQKKLTASDPTKPDDPVIITTDTNSYSN